MPCPIPLGKPSPHPKPGLWQVAHEMNCEPERRGSKNSVFPSKTRSCVIALSAGAGTEAGRKYLLLKASAGSATVTLGPPAGADIIFIAPEQSNTMQTVFIGYFEELRSMLFLLGQKFE